MNDTDQTLPANIDWSTILLHLRQQKLVPFLGAGASLGLDGATGLPSGGALAKALAKECGYPGSDTSDLLRVSQFYVVKIGETTILSF